MAFIDDSGETSVGAMIIFISSILVAAMLAGMFIQVANDVGQQAERTGHQTIRDISTGFDVIGVNGDRNQDGNASAESQSTIQVITIDVQVIAGSAPIPFSGVVVWISDGNNVATLVYNETGTSAEHAGATTFVMIPIRDSDGSLDNGTINAGDIARIVVNTGANATALDIGPNVTVHIEIIPSNGFRCTRRHTAPSVFTNRYVALS